MAIIQAYRALMCAIRILAAPSADRLRVLAVLERATEFSALGIAIIPRSWDVLYGEHWLLLQRAFGYSLTLRWRSIGD